MKISISVIVPFYNSLNHLEECLKALHKAKNENTEIIAVNDFSSDNSGLISMKYADKVICLDTNSGPAFARNTGAKFAKGNILLFVDSDVVVKENTIELISKYFEENLSVDAMFGLYDDSPKEKNLISQYRNLLHRHFHLINDIEVETFWAGCGAIRKEAFYTVNGFNSRKFPSPQIEDIELGYRLKKENYRITINKGIEVKHLKKWTFTDMIYTDIFSRAIPWSNLLLSGDTKESSLNVSLSQRLSAGATMFLYVCIALSFFDSYFGLLALFSLIAIFIANNKLFTFFLQKNGLFFMLFSVPLLILYYTYSSLSYIYSFIVLLSSNHHLENVKTPKTS